MLNDVDYSKVLVGRMAAFWGVGGVALLLVFAIYRLSWVSLQAFHLPLGFLEISVLVINVSFMAYSEGYRGFQLAYAPRVAARAKFLKENPTPLVVLLAPLFCMGFFYTTKKRLIVSYSLTAMIVALILLFQLIAQPWRGILDMGVVVGLGWGLLSILAFSYQAFFGQRFEYSAELPSEALSSS